MDTPVYSRYFSSIFTFLYLYIFTPLSIIVESWILAAYPINMVGDPTRTPERKFRRGVAVFFPFLLSLYAVLASEIYTPQIKLASPFYLVLLAGLVIGFSFMAWISHVDDSDELFATLSCFVSSLIFFAVLTVFIVTRSFEIISFILVSCLGYLSMLYAMSFLTLTDLKSRFLKNGGNGLAVLSDARKNLQLMAKIKWRKMNLIIPPNPACSGLASPRCARLAAAEAQAVWLSKTPFAKQYIIQG